MLWAICLGFVAALIGRGAAIALVSRLSHPSIITFTIGSVLAIALALLVVQMANEPISLSLGDLCD